MKSKVQGRNYLVQQGECDIPEKLNKKATDRSLTVLRKALETVSTVMKDAYETDYTLFKFLEGHLVCGYTKDYSGGTNWALEEAINNIRETEEILKTHDDEIKKPEEAMTLEDLGYRNQYHYKKKTWYEKILEDTEEKEIVEEVIVIENKILRRQRTTIWEKTSYGRSSKNITYKKLRVTKAILRATENTIRKNKRCDDD